MKFGTLLSFRWERQLKNKFSRFQYSFVLVPILIHFNWITFFEWCSSKLSLLIDSYFYFFSLYYWFALQPKAVCGKRSLVNWFFSLSFFGRGFTKKFWNNDVRIFFLNFGCSKWTMQDVKEKLIESRKEI